MRGRKPSLLLHLWFALTLSHVGSSIVHVRLVDNIVLNAGRVEVGYKGIWKSVCDTSWSIKQAHVICRMLGYKKGAAAAIKGMTGYGDVWLSTITCKDRETTIDNCTIKNRQRGCAQDRLAGVVCNSALEPNLAVRLVNGSTPNQGRVEVRYYGVWGTVCDDKWGLADANVFCRMLNYSKASWAGVVKVKGKGPILLDDLVCRGKESSLEYCRQKKWGQHNCNHKEDANVTCQDVAIKNPLAVNVRLIGDEEHFGRVEVQYNGTWIPVCDDTWDILDAHVICRMLGYKAALAAIKKFSVGKKALWIGGIGCNGDEESISQCYHHGWSNRQCKGFYNAGVICKVKKDQSPNIAVRLVNGSTPNQGRVEVRYYGVWGTLCDNAWGLRDAHVVCRMLNYSKASWTGNAKVKGKGAILLDNLRCRGSEKSLEHCPDIRWSRNKCHHYSDAGVRCENVTKEELSVTVRLVGNEQKNIGAVEVKYNGTWRPVCGDSWDISAAHVTCRMLGYKAARAGIKRFEIGKDGYWMRGVVCSGDEISISKCSHHGWLNKECHRNYIVGVICIMNEDPPPVQVRLEEGSSPNSGRVGVRYGNVWGTICSDDELHINDAKVICRMLGYPGASKVYSVNAFVLSSDINWLSNLECNGTENSIVDCRHPGWGQTKCVGNDAGIVCKPADAPQFQINGSNAITDSTVVILLNNSQTSTAQLKSVYQVAVEKRANEQRFKSYDQPLPFSYNEVNVTTATEMGNDSYVTAEILGPISNLTIGDGQYYYGYYNAPLEPGSMYRVHVRIVTMAMDGKIIYGNSAFVFFTTDPLHTAAAQWKHVGDSSLEGAVVGLSGAMVALLLLILCFLWLVIRKKKPDKKETRTEMLDLKNGYNLI